MARKTTRPRPSSATVADVAAAARVSMATVSRVLSGSSYGVSAELRERVLAAARALDYVPNAHARALASATTSTVGVIVHDIADPYFAEITRGILDVAGEADRLVMICHTGREPAKELAYMAALRAQQVKVIILAGSGFDDAEFAAQMQEEGARFQATGGRLALIGRHRVQADSVVADNHGGGYQVGRAITELGHRRIGVLTGAESLTVSHDRMAGFRAALEEAGVTLDADAVAAGHFTGEGGAAGALALLGRRPDLTAIFALNDIMAVGALGAFAEAGIRVPEQVSLAGFTDIPMSRHTAPPLTTVRIPMVELGARALELALAPSGDDGEPRTEHLPAELILRQTLAAPKPG